MRIAICDDDEVSVQLLNNLTVNFFNEHHLDMPLINCYRDGSILLKSGVVPDLVLLDIVMPEMDGTTAVENIIAFDPVATIVIVSSVGTQLQLKKAITAGAKDFIQKPIDVAQVKNLIHTHLGGE